MSKPSEELLMQPGLFRSELKVAIPRLRQDDIEWIIGAFQTEREEIVRESIKIVEGWFSDFDATELKQAIRQKFGLKE